MIEIDAFLLLKKSIEGMDLRLFLFRALYHLLREVHLTRGRETISLRLSQLRLLLTIEVSTRETEELLYVFYSSFLLLAFRID